MLQAFPQIAQYYRRRFRHILVDEYQDTNHAQYVLVRELVGQHLDEYDGWRRRNCAWWVTPISPSTRSAARPSATSRTSSATTPNATTILLEQNYRSTQNILNAANSVISRNTAAGRSGCGPRRARAS